LVIFSRHGGLRPEKTEVDSVAFTAFDLFDPLLVARSALLSIDLNQLLRVESDGRE
jgi:hypothetical protein